MSRTRRRLCRAAAEDRARMGRARAGEIKAAEQTVDHRREIRRIRISTTWLADASSPDNVFAKIPKDDAGFSCHARR